MTRSQYTRRSLVDRRVYERLATASHGAVVLERVARAAGMTNWFVVANAQQLDVVADELLPGSVVTFYFGDQIKQTVPTAEWHVEVISIIRQTGDAVVGSKPPDGEVHLDMDIVVESEELSELTDGLSPGSVVYYGEFPGRDDDSLAITVTLPDADGIVRGHPH